MLELIDIFLKEWLLNHGLAERWANILRDTIEVVAVIIIGIIAYYFAKKVLVSIFHRFTKKTKTKWDDILYSHKFFSYLSYLAPACIFYVMFPVALAEYPSAHYFIMLLTKIYILIILSWIINSVLAAIEEIYQGYEMSKIRPIKPYIQVFRIVVYVIIAIVLFALVFNQSPLKLFAGMGAFTAVLMLIFKDSILGFVGGIQLAANDMLRKGDWISMPKYGADGDVIDIALTTVKVQNFDKTISTIPTYSLISDSFQNWRGMEDSGGRRIKRSIIIDMSSIKFCTPEMLERFKKFRNVSEYVETTEAKLENFNKKHQIDNSILVNGRRQTNIGVFRAYLEGYLKNREDISKEMTFLVRQLQPTERGLPIQIYVFSKVKAWVAYEDIQSDIFDHIFAVVPEFDLELFQNPTGTDFKALANN